MEITRETDYAVRCILHLSESPEEIKMVDGIAKTRLIPKSFLSKILQKLTKSGIVKSYRGVKGGFKLARKPEEISLLDVVEAIDGPVAINRCAVDKRLCDLSSMCVVHPIWVELRKDVENRLKNCNFSELIKLSSMK
ncbi:MAG: Rrf2 family transcriptional regulator [Thermodesulfovibrionales bacterium]|nr:Rrf2 family transcriptional regulator [Thermodesulfovibrionales bacterium]